MLNVIGLFKRRCDCTHARVNPESVVIYFCHEVKEQPATSNQPVPACGPRTEDGGPTRFDQDGLIKSLLIWIRMQNINRRGTATLNACGSALCRGVGVWGGCLLGNRGNPTWCDIFQQKVPPAERAGSNRPSVAVFAQVD